MDRKAAIAELANQVLTQTDIVQVIGDRISITRRGKSFIACCPFHQEKTPSFHVMPKDQFYYCFGCKASGNAIHFLREHDRMAFFEALEYLARQAGIELPQLQQRENQVDPEEREWLDNISNFYQQALRNSPPAIEYLKNRGITGQIAKQFAIGFAPDQWEALLQQFNTSNEAAERLHRHGLIITKDTGRRYDRFRNRIIFPIRDSRGQTIAFGARTLGDDTPKYLNSPQTPLFHKSEALYGIYELLNSDRRPEFILVVEGYMDVIALHQLGIPQVVATLGTASNQGHLRQLQRHADRIVYCFDGDQAGRDAAWHALLEALPILHERLDLRFLFLPEGEDPDSFVRQNGTDAMLKLINSAQSLSDTFFKHLQSQYPQTSLDEKARCAQAAMTAINTMPPGLLQNLLIRELGSQLDIEANTLESLLENKKPKNSPDPTPQQTPQQTPRPTQNDKPIAPIQRALMLVVKSPDLCTQAPDIQQSLSELAHQLPHPPRELKLLLNLMSVLKKQPTLTTGQLINLFEQPGIQQYLLSISAQPDAIDPKLHLAELTDALHLSWKWCLDALIQSLIDQSKSDSFSTNERKKLQYLLSLRAKDCI